MTIFRRGGVHTMINFSLLLMFCFLNQSQAVDNNVVAVSLCYESLCPYSANFIVNQLVNIFQTDLISVVKLRFVPWGNTQISANSSWICQHGPDECMLNMVEACVIRAWPDPIVHYKFIYCIERLRLKNKHKQWKSCFHTLHFSSVPIKNCFSSGLAVKIEQGYADETARLNPPLTSVPWVLVNNIPLKKDYQNFVAYICRLYRGEVMPQACRSHRFRIDGVIQNATTLN